MLGMIDRVVIGYRPFGDVKLVVSPEFAHSAPIYENEDRTREAKTRLGSRE